MGLRAVSQPISAETAQALLDALAGGASSAVGNVLISGGGVAMTTGLGLIVGAGEYSIQGTTYSSVETTLAAAAADPTNPRIDVVALNSSGAAVLITGTPAATPIKPYVDPLTQLELTFFIVAAGATSLNTTIVSVYAENTEWTTSQSGANFTLASTNNPRAGTKCVEGTAVVAGNYVQFAAAAPADPALYDNLIFYIRSKASWTANRALILSLRLAGAQVGNLVTFKTGTFSFDSAVVSGYQQISIPMSAFAAAGLSFDQIRMTMAGSSSIGMYLDDITLQAGLRVAAVDGSRMRWRGDHSLLVLYEANDVTISGGVQYVAKISNINQAPPNATYWKASSSAGGGIAVDVQTFTGNGTWTKPAGCTLVEVVCIGGGGGGGGGGGFAAGTRKDGGGGGGGGAYAAKVFKAADLAATEAIVVGAAGAAGTGGTTGSGTDATAGGNSSFGGVKCEAFGGGAGKGGNTAASGVSGGGGGGSGGAGANGTTGSVLGGAPAATAGANGVAGQGGGSALNNGGHAEYGGGGGGGSTGATSGSGGGSIFGGGGGACGGMITAAGGENFSGRGGRQGGWGYTTGGGTTGPAGVLGSGTNGGAGGAGDSTKCGGGGAGGADNLAGTGGIGGAGGILGGGGGGGGPGTPTGGAGGVGGRGEVRVYAW